ADIPAEATYFGTPARSHREYLRAQVALYRLAKIVDDLERVVQQKPVSVPPPSPPPSPSPPPPPPAPPPPPHPPLTPRPPPPRPPRMPPLQPANARRSVTRRAAVRGTGLHTGAATEATFLPALSGQGIVFRRVDLAGKPEVPARLTEVEAVERRTAIGHGNA